MGTRMNESHGYGFVNGLFMGAVLGAMGALVLAPKSGKRLRRDIDRGARRLKRRAGDTVEELVARGHDVVDSAKDVVTDARQTVQEAARSVRR